MAITVMHLMEDSFDKGLWDDMALYSLPFSLFMWYNKSVSSYPYKCLSWNLLLGSSMNLAILMQCLSLLQSFHVGQADLTQWATVLTNLNLGFIYGGIFIIQWVIVPFPGHKG